MTALGACLVATTPIGPGADVLEVIVVADAEEGGDQSTDLWDSQWDTLWLFAGLLIGAPFATAPRYCRRTPTDLSPFFTTPLSSMTNTADGAPSSSTT